MILPREGRHHAEWSAAAPDGRPGFTDIHCHCLPGLDDGPAGMIETLALCRALTIDGIETVVATPHQLGRFEGRYDARAVRRAVGALNAHLQEARIPLAVLPGADVRLDERLGQLLRADTVLTVADGRRYLLLELPHEVFIDPGALLLELAALGITAIITHPERHPHLARHPDLVRRWAEHGTCLQITAGSFGGDFGRASREAAWTFLQAPLPLVVATDAHDTGARSPRMSEAYRLLAQQLGYLAADILCRENPRRIVAGQALLRLAPSDLAQEVTR